MKNQQKTIAIIEAGGTGLEVADIFQKCLNKIYSKKINYLSFKKNFGYSPHTFLELRKNIIMKIG